MMSKPHIAPIIQYAANYVDFCKEQNARPCMSPSKRIYTLFLIGKQLCEGVVITVEIQWPATLWGFCTIAFDDKVIVCCVPFLKRAYETLIFMRFFRESSCVETLLQRINRHNLLVLQVWNLEFSKPTVSVSPRKKNTGPLQHFQNLWSMRFCCISGHSHGQEATLPHLEFCKLSWYVAVPCNCCGCIVKLWLTNWSSSSPTRTFASASIVKLLPRCHFYNW